MSTDRDYNFNVVFNVKGIDESVRKTQRVLYLFNAVRLSIMDLQQLASKPNLGQLLWTAVQLTRVWSHLHRVITMTNKAQRAGAAQGLLGGRQSLVRGVSTGQTFFGTGGELVLPTASLLQQFINMGALITPIGAFPLAGIATGLIVGGVAFAGLSYRQRRMQEQWRQRQREIAKAQGLEY